MYYLWLAVFCGALISTKATDDRLKVTFRQLDIEFPSNDDGHVQNCGKTALNVTWSPKVINSDQPVTVEGQITTAAEFNGGKIHLDVKVMGFPISKEFPFTCATLKTLGIKDCPIQKGDTISFKQSTTIFSMMKSYPGDYVIKGVLTNERGQEVVCGIVTAKVTA